VAYDEGNYTEALSYAKKALRLDPTSSSLFTNLGSISIGELFRGNLILQESTGIARPPYLAVFGIGSVLATLGNHPQAMIYYETLKLIQQQQQLKEPYNVTFGLIERADILMGMGNYSQSLNIIQQVTSL